MTSAWFKNFVLFVITVSVSIVCADFLVKFALHIPSNYLPKIVYFNPALEPEKRLRPNLSLKAIGDMREFTFHVATDDRGFRKSWSNQDNTRPVVFLGDSQTFGIGVQGEETFAYRFGEASGISTVNTGVPGYNNVEQLALLRSEWANLQPQKVVLCFFAGNDAFENFKIAAQPDSEASVGAQPRKTFFSEVKNFLVKKSALYQLLMRLRRFPAVNRLLQRFGLIEAQPPGELVIFSSADTKKLRSFWQVTDHVLAQIQEEVRKHASELIVLFIPDRYQVDDAFWAAWRAKYQLAENEYDLTAPNRHIREFCLKNNIPFVDPTQALAQAHKKGEAPYWKIDNHLSPQGHLIISRVLEQHFSGKAAS